MADNLVLSHTIKRGLYICLYSSLFMCQALIYAIGASPEYVIQ
jgi:hypothetical protein